MRAAAAIACLACAAPVAAAAEPLRLRGDALATAHAPTGLVTLEADGDVDEGVRAEAMLWFGAGEEGEVDALVATVHARDARRRVVARLGRFVAITGALRPVHVDGATARVRLPRRFALEAFGGVPVAPALGDAAWDWVAGGRVSRLLGDWGSVGAAYLQRRDHGRLTASELGLDASAATSARTDVGGRVAFDAIHGGISDALISASARRGAWRAEVYAGERSAAALLPATSLFSVIGDVPSRRAGVGVRWRAAPRLDLAATFGGRALDDDLGADLTARATLRLDDRGAGALGLELRRDTGAGVAGWTGVRGTARVPVGRGFALAAEVELVAPDDLDQRWPWALGAATWRRGPWELAAAVEASATRAERYRVDALARIGRTWGAP